MILTEPFPLLTESQEHPRAWMVAATPDNSCTWADAVAMLNEPELAAWAPLRSKQAMLASLAADFRAEPELAAWAPLYSKRIEIMHARMLRMLGLQGAA